MATAAVAGLVRSGTAGRGSVLSRMAADVRAVLAAAMRAFAARRHQLQALDTFDRIDARTLRDVGIDRGAVTLTD